MLLKQAASSDEDDKVRETDIRRCRTDLELNGEQNLNFHAVCERTHALCSCSVRRPTGSVGPSRIQPVSRKTVRNPSKTRDVQPSVATPDTDCRHHRRVATRLLGAFLGKRAPSLLLQCAAHTAAPGCVDPARRRHLASQYDWSHARWLVCVSSQLCEPVCQSLPRLCHSIALPSRTPVFVACCLTLTAVTFSLVAKSLLQMCAPWPPDIQLSLSQAQ